MNRITLSLFGIVLSVVTALGQSKSDLNVLAYYSAGPDQVDGLPAEKLTHIIFSFCHLQGNKLVVDNASDSLTIKKLVGLKKRNSKLKVLLSLGGWGGCKSCSDAFSTAGARNEFSQSVLVLSQGLQTDGIDLDWEYPTIEGYPGHPFKPEDKVNFSELVISLRNTLGSKFEISFAAGGFQKFLDESVDWQSVMKVVDRVNVMSYDLINGYSQVTGHHTALYSNPKQAESTHNAVQYLINIGVPRSKIVIGAAFYARVWEHVPGENNGLYQQGKFKESVDFRNFEKGLKGFQWYWDETTQAPYAYNKEEKLFATADDRKSMAIKTKYAIDQKLNGIMFWELSLDVQKDGLVDTINKVKRGDEK
ncbi:MAG: glycosyl hydrolase family 18 protein [Cyclobacteriaceae bacterium]